MANIIKKIMSFSPRQFEGETKTRFFIEDYLNRMDKNYLIQKFNTYIPKSKKCVLKVDGENIQCLPCTFKVGKIDKGNILLDALKYNGLKNIKAIAYNSKCKSISLCTFFFYPSLAISPKYANKIKNSKNINGFVKVEKTKHQSANILVGNTINPEKIIFTHYDSIGKGAVDNASGVAVALKLIENLSKNSLVVLAGNEELSYDQPIYWGHGYRVFEKKYFNLLNKCKKIIAIDSVGNDRTAVFDKRNKKIMKIGFPFKNSSMLKNKFFCISGGFDKLMEVYHSDRDNFSQIKSKYLKEALEIVIKL